MLLQNLYTFCIFYQYQRHYLSSLLSTGGKYWWNHTNGLSLFSMLHVHTYV